jgi:hypothetical protein
LRQIAEEPAEKAYRRIDNAVPALLRMQNRKWYSDELEELGHPRGTPRRDTRVILSVAICHAQASSNSPDFGIDYDFACGLVSDKTVWRFHRRVRVQLAS